MLFLLTDVGEDDARHPHPGRLPTSTCPACSSRPATTGCRSWSSARRLGPTEARPVAVATGEAGDVYVCHPFLVHAAQIHRGERPRIIAQPGLAPVGDTAARPARRRRTPPSSRRCASGSGLPLPPA